MSVERYTHRTVWPYPGWLNILFLQWIGLRLQRGLQQGQWALLWPIPPLVGFKSTYRGKAIIINFDLKG